MRTRGIGRRSFLKKAAIAGALATQDEALLPQEPGKSPARSAASASAIAYPRAFTGPQLAMIAFPLGGVGSGSISLGGRGQLRDWEIFNRADKGHSPQYAFASIWARNGGGKPVARVVESRLEPPYEGQSGLGTANVPGLPRLSSCTFIGEFPMAKIVFRDPDLPVSVTLEAFTPFIPLNADDSGLPIAILRYRVLNSKRQKATVAIAFSIDNPVGREGRANEFRETAALQGLLMSNPFLPQSDPLAGSFALCALNAEGAKFTSLRGWRGGSRWRVGPQQFWDDFTRQGELGPEPTIRDAVGSLCVRREIAPQAEAEYTFLLAWHFPNRTPARCGWQPPKGHAADVIGNFYSTRFADAWQAAEYAATHLPDLEKQTREFVAAVRDSTLPAPVREAAMANLSTLVTPTCFRTADGNFHGFEGSNNQGGCCFGNCTHVWNYEVATAHLFPSLSRSLREAAFGFCTDEGGKMDIRQLLPGDLEHFGYAAADGQMGQIMKLYLDWQLSGDTDWLRKLWPAAKRALAFAWIPGGWDANRDGVMEGVQHNTYDVEFIGPNPLCGIWYLGALRAAEEMARVLDDSDFARECRELFEKGSRWVDANLFNGEYYVQKIHGVPKGQVAPGLLSGMGSSDTESPDFQLGEGCLVDQLLGQYFANTVALGPLLDSANVQKALRSILKYNYKHDLYNFESVQRIYALNDEAALVICDYPHGSRPKIPFPYFAEVMTGFEYAAAALMISEGMISQGTEVIENVRRRYDGVRRNPWNEAECGHHYARAMASWTALVLLSGFHYHAGKAYLTARPLISEDNFASFWSTGSAWGRLTQVREPGRVTLSLTVHAGTLSCRFLDIRRPHGFGFGPSSVKLNSRELRDRQLRGVGDRVLVRLGSGIEVTPGKRLLVTW